MVSFFTYRRLALALALLLAFVSFFLSLGTLGFLPSFVVGAAMPTPNGSHSFSFLRAKQNVQAPAMPAPDTVVSGAATPLPLDAAEPLVFAEPGSTFRAPAVPFGQDAAPPRLSLAATRPGRALNTSSNLPPNFIEALERYRAMHAWATSPRELQALARGEREGGARFIIAELHNLAGLCNRMMHVSSALLYGMLTDRALLFSWTAQPAEKYSDGVETIAQADFADLFAPLAGFEFGLNNVAERAGISVEEIMRTSRATLDYDLKQETLRCGRPDAAIPHRVLRVARFEWWAAMALHNPHVRDTVIAWFSEDALNGGAIFQHVAGALFSPSPSVLQLVNKAEAPDSACAVGVQIRRHWSRATADDASFFACSQHLRKWLDTIRNPAAPAAVSPFWRLVTDASDSSALTYFSSRMNPSALRQPVFDGACRSDRTCLQQAVADIQLLSHCDVVVTTDSSTFGRCAAALGGRPYGIVTADGQCLASGIPDPINAGVIAENLAGASTPWSNLQYECPKPSPRACITYLFVEPSEHDFENLK